MTMMTAFVSGLTDEETAVFTYLMNRHGEQRSPLELLDAYYKGEQVMEHLGISVPPQLQRLSTVIGWPQLAVDTIDERLAVEGFRFKGSTEIDSRLDDIWQANNMDEEHRLAHLDALTMCRSFIVVGSGKCDGASDCPPLVTVESPLDMTVIWNAQARHVSAAVHPWEMAETEMVTFYLPHATITLRMGLDSWVVEEYDQHNLGVVPVVRMANKPRSNARDGRSEITPAVMSVTDAACRTLLGMEVAREFYGAPQRYILGASESAFQDAEGNQKSAWETYIGRILALERDENGDLPQVGQFTPYNPSVYTDIIDMYSRVMASITGLPPAFLGETTANPASADAIRSAESRLNKIAQRRQTSFENGWEEAMRLALMISDPDLKLPEGAHAMETVWAPVETPTPAATTDAITKQVASGALPAESDVTLERLGYSSVERERIRIDRQRMQGARAVIDIFNRATQAVPVGDNGVNGG